MTPQPGKQITAIQTLPGISQNQNEGTMKFGQIIEYNKRNILLQNSCQI